MMSSYTSQELSTIAQAPTLVGMAVAIADLGIVSTAIEATAMSKEIAGAAKKYPNNSIIQSVFAEEVLRSGAIKLERPHIEPEDAKSGAVVDRAILAVNAAIAAVGDKATAEEIHEFKVFVYSCAEAVANAAGSGLFGSGSSKV
ncbi:hypothetical protein H6F67_27060 [Microcoleus sp. FACHB-1515]|uniref:hypothetical protein n=1 Tax=Cyanophyceae TaxID=3028117 RepID=UPI001684BA86|nr:hypothetical protein [Microcoleus sp. FACHB-1515]MBD2093501.1 hypothetical protein [Microcoleus sp. FACHB-1515]